MVKTLLIAGVAALALTAPAKAADTMDFSPFVDVWRIGILGGENEADRLKNYACLSDYITKEFGVPVELYPASDYAGVIQSLLAGTIESAHLGASGYAAVYLQDPDAVEPLVTEAQLDGSTGYYSGMYVLASSDIRSIEDMRGRSLAFADPNSTSGYLVPSFELNRAGYALEGSDAFFGQVGFSGGHEQGIVAMLNGQYDAAVTWISGQGTLEEGYSRGMLRNMVDKGALDTSQIREIWRSPLIANGPLVVRKELPQELKDAYKTFLLGMIERDADCYRNITSGEGAGYAEVDHSFYEGIVEMRRGVMASRRN
jgi:phosphonate transport system substrate-binding protein